MKKDELNLNKSSKTLKLYKGFTAKQFIFFIAGIIVFVAGLVCTVLGLIGDYAFIPNNIFEGANDYLAGQLGGITLTWLGVILVVIGGLVIALSLNFSSHTEEREKEKEERRKERIRSFKEAREKDVVIDISATSASETSTENK